MIPPCSLIAAIVSANDIPPGMVRSRNRPMISPSLLLTSSPTMTRTPYRSASSRASRPPAALSWSVMATTSRPTSRARSRMSATGITQSLLWCVWMWKSANSSRCWRRRRGSGCRRRRATSSYTSSDLAGRRAPSRSGGSARSACAGERCAAARRRRAGGRAPPRARGTSRGGTSSPVPSLSTTSSYPGISEATTAAPEAMASSSATPAVSGPSEGAQYTSAARSSVATSRCGSRPWKRTRSCQAGGTRRA